MERAWTRTKQKEKVQKVIEYDRSLCGNDIGGRCFCYKSNKIARN